MVKHIQFDECRLWGHSAYDILLSRIRNMVICILACTLQSESRRFDQLANPWLWLGDDVYVSLKRVWNDSEISNQMPIDKFHDNPIQWVKFEFWFNTFSQIIPQIPYGVEQFGQYLWTWITLSQCQKLENQDSNLKCQRSKMSNWELFHSKIWLYLVCSCHNLLVLLSKA